MATDKFINLSNAESGKFYLIISCNFKKEQRKRLSELGFFAGNKLFVCFSKSFLVVKLSSCRFFFPLSFAEAIIVKETKALL